MKTTAQPIAAFRCASCHGYHGQRVFRMKNDWRFYWPGPIDVKHVDRERDGRQSSADIQRERDEASADFANASGLFHSKLDKIDLSTSTVCNWCQRHGAKPSSNPNELQRSGP